MRSRVFHHSPSPNVSADVARIGRLLIAQGGVDALKIGVTIALRYACQRPQFGDKTIMGYLTHQDRLLPVLANAYALHLALGSLKVMRLEGEGLDLDISYYRTCVLL